jgi:hypothetical protein
MQTDNGRLDLRDLTLTEVDFSGRRLEYLTCTNTTFVRCDFRNMRVRHASLAAGNEHSRYESCVFDGSTLKMGPAGQATFVNCGFRGVRISDWECRVVSLTDCTFSGTLRDCIFTGRLPEDYRAYLGRDSNEIRGNDFSEAALTKVYFVKGVDLSQQRLPAGPDYFYLPDAAAAVAAARQLTADWPDEERASGERFLKTFDRQIADGQVQFFGRTADYTRGYAGVAERIVAYWRAASPV